MKKLAAFLTLFFVAPLALTATLTISWTNATTNVDGSTIPASGPGSVTTRIEYGTCNAGRTAIATVLGTIDAATGASTTVTPDLPPGAYCARAWHVNTYGIASDPTAVVARDVAAPKPNPPSNFSFGS